MFLGDNYSDRLLEPTLNQPHGKTETIVIDRNPIFHLEHYEARLTIFFSQNNIESPLLTRTFSMIKDY